MVSYEEIELFFKALREKLLFHPIGIVFRPRNKNLESLALLDIVPGTRNDIIKKLTALNYIRGPKNNSEDPKQPCYYEFGVMIKDNEMYIKISIGLINKPIDCMSFHIAEYEMNYPLKKQKNER